MKSRSKRFLAAALSCAMIISGSCASASADSSTTTIDTAYKTLDPQTEIYAVTSAPGSDYRYYGAKWEPQKGTYYGRVALGGTLDNGQYGVLNQSQVAGESAVSFYHEINSPYQLQEFNYIFEPVIEDGNHVLLINLNYTNEGNDCTAIINGDYDSRLITDFQYLSTLNCPVFIRIGGEVNAWTTMPSTASFIQSFQHIASLVRTCAPDAATVFSPNFSSGHKIDMDSFYPGDSYVDWIGVSLYYNKYSGVTGAKPEFLGIGEYGDAMLNVQQTVNLSRLHSKPVIVTEGGSFNSFNGEDTSQFASERVSKAYSFLTMLYPEIKCMIYSDTNFGSSSEIYTIYNNYTMSQAYNAAVSANPTLTNSCSNPQASYYTRLSAMSSSWSGSMTLAAYSYSSAQLTAAWYIDGQWYSQANNYPFTCTVDTDSLASGSHTVMVKFSDGNSKSYQFTVSGVTASPTNDTLYVDGVQKSPEVYKIDGTNYFKLRDVAALMNGTAKQFSVDYDNNTKQAVLTSGQPYAPLGTELSRPDSMTSVPASQSNNVILVNGEAADMDAYKINGNNYIKLRDLGQALGFYVGYDSGKMIISS